MSTLLFYNFKGGVWRVGKTTLSVIAADYFSRRKKNVLLVDLDQQTSATLFFQNSYTIKPKETLYDGFVNENLDPCLCHIREHLDILPGDWFMKNFEEYALKVPSKNRFFILRRLLAKYRDKYDYIILDVPPSTNAIVSNAAIASDYIVLVLQSQKASYDMALRSVRYLNDLRNDYGASYKMLGIALYLVSKRSATDRKIVAQAQEDFGQRALFSNRIYYSERVKTWSNEGMTHNQKDVNDRKTHKMYDAFMDEIVKRIEA